MIILPGDFRGLFFLRPQLSRGGVGLATSPPAIPKAMILAGTATYLGYANYFTNSVATAGFMSYKISGQKPHD
jgi:hypothetical protein